jgi:Predicted RNA-binding protein, contains TRAM domain
MDIPAQLQCLFSASIEERENSYVVEIPDQEVDLGSLQQGETYRVAFLSAIADTDTKSPSSESHREREPPESPVEEGEQRTVDIENTGDKGDGITRVERGFVVIVPGTDVGERVTIEITDVSKNVAFADVVTRLE